MAKTVVGLFDNSQAAQRAVVELVDGGIPREDIGVTSQNYGAGVGYDNTPAARRADDDEGIGDKISNFFSSLFGGDDSEDTSYYTEAVSRGGTVITVDAETDELADRATAILERYGADVDERDTAYNETGYAADTTATRGTARADLREGAETRLPVMEEQLQVGKREVERGGVRVRTRVVERPVEEVVRLREERVNVERRPVNRPVTDEDLNAFREGTFELTERAEEAVVNKQARVVEEVAVSKEVGERDETVRDTVRRTDVDVEETGRGRARGASATAQDDYTQGQRKR